MRALATLSVTLMLAAGAYQASGPAAAQPPAAAPPAAAPAPPPSTGRSCFWIRSIRGFRSIDNRNVFVRASGRDIFQLELFSPCLGVDWAHRVSLQARGSQQICEGRANWVNLHVRQAGGGRPLRCSVSNVRKLTPEEVANLPRRAIP
jgi:hypothetical protein